MTIEVAFYPHHILRWRKKTSHISMEEKGVYREILDAMYLHGGKLPCDIRQLGRVIGVQTAGERKALSRVVQLFLKKDGEFFTQKTVEEELVKIKNRSSKSSENAKAKYSKNNYITSADAERQHSGGSATALLLKTSKYKTTSASPVLTSARQADKKIFEEKEIKTAKRGELAWIPDHAESEILPGGWSDIAEALSLHDEQIFKSWAKFKATSTRPFQIEKWRGWIKREHGAISIAEAAE